MSQNVIQTSFTAGEFAPTLDARVDLAKYKSAAALMRNWFVDYRSGTSTRTGTRFVIQVYISSSKVRVVEFQYNVLITYVLEFGDEYIRFITNGGAVLETAFVISTATNGNPGQITVAGHNFVNGDWIFIDGIVGATGYNNRFVVPTVSGDVLTLFDVNGNPIDAADFGTYLSGGTAARVYKIDSPYAAADLPLLKFKQSASVLTITHPDYDTRNLVRSGATNWALNIIDFETSAATPTGLAGAASSVGAANYAYKVTSVDADGQESEASAAADVAAAVNLSTTAGSITLTWNAAANADFYRVYKAAMRIGAAVPANVQFGFIGFSDGLSFVDSNVVPDFSNTPPIPNNPFEDDNHPATSGYFEQRQVFAGSDDNPITFYMSQPGAFNNFDYSNPIQPDDYIEGTLVSGQVNAIKDMVAMPGGLILMTSKGAWQVSGGGSDSGVSPSNIKATPQAFNGIGDVRPLVVNNNILFVQEKGATVRDLAYKFESNIYTGMDISVLSNHLFIGYTITEWAYAEEPFKLVYAIRNDGILLLLTYVKEQEVYGWAHADTLGTFESVAAITEGEVDATYVVVKRFIGGEWLQFIERFAEREFTYGAEDMWAVDCGIQSTLPEPAAGLTASSSTGECTFTADAAVFTSADDGKVLRMGGGIAPIHTFVSPTQLIGTLSRDIQKTLPNSEDDTPLPALSGEWSLTTPFTEFSGLDHLNGQTVSINADGGVITPQEVVDGKITLPTAVTKVTAGLGFEAPLQTLRLEAGSEGTIQAKRKKIAAVTLRLSQSRGLQMGSTFDTLKPMKERPRSLPLNRPIEPITGDNRLVMDPSWNTEGQICILVDDPLCATICGVIPEIVVGDKDNVKDQ